MKDEKIKNTVHARRAVSYTVLIIISFLCLFWFYVLFINATRSNGELGKGFTAIPSTHLIENLTNLFTGTLPVLRGMLNSLIIAGLSAAACTYFSTMTAYSIHAYDYAGRKAIFTFILTIMMIPTQVTALGFVKLVQNLHLENDIDGRYFDHLADEAKAAIEQYEDFEKFTADGPIDIPDPTGDYPPWCMPCGEMKYDTCLDCPHWEPVQEDCNIDEPFHCGFEKRKD